MYKYFYIRDVRIPSYSIMVILGVVICNFIAQIIIKKKKINYGTFVLIEATGAIGAVIGAKMLSALTSCIIGHDPFLIISAIKSAGYSYYGGLLGFLLSSFLACKLFQIDGKQLARELIFLLPLLQAIWRIGCFMGGCCYGIPYKGIFSVCYENGVNQMAGIQVFPVQLLESMTSIVIMLVMLGKMKKNKLRNPVEIYLILYGGTRFFVEFLRFHETQTILSIGQINSLVCGCIGAILIYIKYRRKISNE